MARFLADCNVGRLARWLRALGYDAAYESRLADPQVVGRALAEDRILLTRDADMMRRRLVSGGAVRAILLRDDRVEDQLRQVLGDLGLAPERALTRCLECNVELEPQAKASVIDELPPYVRLTQERCGVTVNEGWDPAVTADAVAHLRELIPREHEFAHAEGNSDSHIKTMLVGTSACLPVSGGRLALGRWQAVFLCEFDGPRERELWVSLTPGQ